MKRRWRQLFGLTVLLLLAVPFFPSVYWHVQGWAHAQAFFQARPTCYWARGVAKCEMVDSFLSGDVYFFPRKPTATQQLLTRLFGISFPTEDAVRWLHDPNAVPVLIELLAHEDLTVQLFAIQTLGHLGPQATSAAEQLRKARATTSEYLAFREAGIALWCIDRTISAEVNEDRRDGDRLFERYKANLGFGSR